jgi:tetratricopeptide (TPR) repeat protein
VKRFITTLALATATLATTTIVSTTPAHAQQPSPADMKKAKEAFDAGKAAHAAGKFDEAIEKYKIAYTLSKKPVLLYNVAVAMADAGMDDLALINFRKYLKEAPADDGQRPDAEAKVKALETKLGIGTTPANPPVDPNAGKPKPPIDNTPKPPVAIKPPGTYTEADFQHMVVDTAPPKTQLDITASVPEDSGWTVTLYYRTAGEGKFASKQMKWRYKELVARIPANKMLGSAVQYYIEAKDAAGTQIAKSGKSTSPNQVLLEAGATPRFYPDMSDEGDAKVAPKDVLKSDNDDDPLNKTKKPKVEDPVVGPTGPVVQGNGMMDVGSSKFSKAKWTATIGGGALLGFAALSFVQAKKYAGSLEDDSTACGMPPCRSFTTADDTYAQDVESTGKRWNTFFKVGIGAGVVVTGVAAYFWVKEMKAKKRGEVKVSASGKAPEASWFVVPAIGEHTAGAAGVVRF